MLIPGSSRPVDCKEQCMASPEPPTGSRRKRFRPLLHIVLGLLVLRIVLPYVLLHLLNDRLAKVPGYYGHAVDLDLALIRGAYRIEGLFLDHVDSVSHERTSFVSAEVIDLSVEWKALFHGSVVGELVIDRPSLSFTKDKVEPAEVQKDTTSLGDLLDDLMPLRINRVEVKGGELHYRDLASKPKVDVLMDDLDVLALNIRNSYDSTDVLPARVKATASVYGGRFDLGMRLDPLARDPAFDLDMGLEGMRLTEFNDFFKAYADVDVNEGVFGLYSEIATEDRRFAGYVKPVIMDLDVLGPEDKGDTFFRKLWEGLAGTAGAVLTNPKHDQVATKLEFSGELDKPDTHLFYAIVDLVRNAFIRAIQPSIDQEISIVNVGEKSEEEKSFFKRLFRKEE